MLRAVLRSVKEMHKLRRLPKRAQDEVRRDRRGLPTEDPGSTQAIGAGLRWLARAQDSSPSQDGGFARHWSLLSGWTSSYPETTGYIVPTLLACAARYQDESLRQRARRALDWLISLEQPGGGYLGGRVDAPSEEPVTFNTGQVLLGLAAGARDWEEFRAPMRRTADWLVATQDADGCWRRFPSPFNLGGDKPYETHVSWGLLEAARIDPDRGYAEAAERQITWALTQQADNGWIDECCLNRRHEPLTHTLGYALRGILELHRYARRPDVLRRAQRTGDGLMQAMSAEGFLPGRLRADWSPAVEWSCLTGTAQIAACWFILHAETRDTRYLDAAWRANRFVRSTMRVDGDNELEGGVKGSFPVNGQYGPFQFVSWACKFMVDANLMEEQTLEPGPDSADD